MFHMPSLQLQIDFSFMLSQMRSLYLQDALSKTVGCMDIGEIDRELGVFVTNSCLAAVASNGLRGELVFPVPCVLHANPKLLAYYRLLLGYSKKEFYTKATGAGVFIRMEEDGIISAAVEYHLEEFCQALIGAACDLVEGIGPERLSRNLLDDLTLLTLGPQFRGGMNNKIGIAATAKVFEVIHAIVRHAATATDSTKIVVTNAAGRDVFIEFASDPDIIIREEMAGVTVRRIVAIEVKGGKDYSNIHNRIGEAEKSHQKAKGTGYKECWTIINVENLDMAKANKESPTTDSFYTISSLLSGTGENFNNFRSQIISLCAFSRSTHDRTQKRPSCPGAHAGVAHRLLRQDSLHPGSGGTRQWRDVLNFFTYSNKTMQDSRLVS
jgi:XcyI restriction endonuclease